MSYLVFGGATGWIGGKLVELLRHDGQTVHVATSRLEDRCGIEEELDRITPKFVLNAAGVTGRPNVDWCESNKHTTIRTNVIGTLTLIDACHARGIHVTNFATGCIYGYDDEHPIGGKGFTEEDPPNFHGSFYSKTKALAETLIREYDNVLTLRVRMPISDDLHPRSFVTKITRYEKVVDIPNSMTILHDMLPIGLDLTRRERKGVYNFTNPGAISHNQILKLYKEYVDPNFTWTNFTLEEQAKVLKAPRSNNTLDVSKMLAEYPDLPEVHASMVELFKRMAVIERKQQ